MTLVVIRCTVTKLNWIDILSIILKNSFSDKKYFEKHKYAQYFPSTFSVAFVLGNIKYKQ